MHLFRRYINNRGSALFMVISVMTAIMVSCMAMYFSVVSSRSSQYAVFNQQQSRSSAESIADAVLAGIMEGNSKFTPLLTEIQNLKVGEKLTTNGNNFKAFSSSGTKEDEDNIGAYMVEITKLSDNSFDLIVTSSVNGVNNVKHTIVEFSVEEGGDTPAAPTQIFAATGYVPNDVFLEGGNYHADMFYDNELTILDAFEGIDAHITGDFSIGGSILNMGGMYPMGDKSVVYAINGTYTSNTSTVSVFPAGSSMLVGGDVVMNGGGGFENVNVYVLGDMYVFSNGLASKNCHFFVDGNVYMHKDVNDKMGLFKANGNYIYIDANGSINEFKTVSSQKTTEKWDDSVSSKGCFGPDAMLDELKARTASNDYYKWVINETLPKKEIKFSHGSNPVSVVELKYDKAKKDTGCTITGISVGKDGRQFTDHAIVIDTGDDPNNVYTIRVTGLYDLDNNGTKETFMWYPFSEYDASVRMNVIVKGRGSVVIDVPEGVVYQDINQIKFMHYDWWLLCGGRVVDKTVNGKTIQIYDINASGSWLGGGMENLLKGFVHTNCNASCTCEYTENKTKTKCTIHSDEYMITVNCTIHDDIGTYCPKCFPSLVGPDEKGNPHDHTGDCKLRVGRQELDDYLATRSDLKKLMLDKDGKMIYPTTNIYLVSCEESAEFRFSQTKEYTNIVQKSVTSMTFDGNKKKDSDGVDKYYVTLKCKSGTANDIAKLIKDKEYDLADNVVVEGDKVLVFVKPHYREWKNVMPWMPTNAEALYNQFQNLDGSSFIKTSTTSIKYNTWADQKIDDDGIQKFYVTLECRAGTADDVAAYIRANDFPLVDHPVVEGNKVLVFAVPYSEEGREYEDWTTRSNGETLLSQFQKMQKTGASAVEGNAFFGYVYAPYMTFKGYGDGSGGGWVRMMGGMTVSDYILDDSYTTIACWPEKMPTDLMSDESLKNQLAGISGKTWKITPKRHG